MAVFRAISVLLLLLLLLLHDVPFQIEITTADQPLTDSFSLFYRDSCGPPYPKKFGLPANPWGIKTPTKSLG